MPSQYPIYLNLKDYNDSSRNKGFGTTGDCKIIVNVGSSSKYSKELARIEVNSYTDLDNKVFVICINSVDICQIRFNPKTKEFSNVVDLINKE